MAMCTAQPVVGLEMECGNIAQPLVNLETECEHTAWLLVNHLQIRNSKTLSSDLIAV